MIGIPGRALAAVSAIGLAASLTGCQFVEVGKGDGDSSATHPATSQEVKSTLADTQAAAGSTDPVEVNSELPVVATRQTSDNDTPLSVTLNSVSVTGGDHHRHLLRHERYAGLVQQYLVRDDSFLRRIQ